MSDQKAIESRLKRRAGMSPEKREALEAFNLTQTYHGQCRVCRTTLSGTLAELRKGCPVCGEGRG